MQKKTSAQITEQELGFLEKLRLSPQLGERFAFILNLTQYQSGSGHSLDQTEEALIEQMRCLGNESVRAWAKNAEKRLAEELQQKEPAAKARKKKR